ncbi:zinc finger CCHC-type containing 10 [Rhodotorula paludigena]|uniref:zinc finger CCHC-type containing 10 n=1 Tax=Rhodotorula paludigena TaxID=86838 RepID=UPI003176E0E0
MQSNYLGLAANRSSSSASSSFGGRGGGGPGRSNQGNGGARYGKQPTATPSTRCQKCNQLGHYTYDCKNPREYKVRPTRTQILKNPKLRTPLTESAPPRTEDMPKEGTAAAILAANEAKRQAKLKAAAAGESSRGRSSRRGRSASSQSQSQSREE